MLADLRRALACLLTAFVSTIAVAQQSYQGIWWAAPAGAESGWGINFTHQGDVVLKAWFAGP